MLGIWTRACDRSLDELLDEFLDIKYIRYFIIHSRILSLKWLSRLLFMLKGFECVFYNVEFLFLQFGDIFCSVQPRDRSNGVPHLHGCND